MSAPFFCFPRGLLWATLILARDNQQREDASLPSRKRELGGLVRVRLLSIVSMLEDVFIAFMFLFIFIDMFMHLHVCSYIFILSFTARTCTGGIVLCRYVTFTLARCQVLWHRSQMIRLHWFALEGICTALEIIWVPQAHHGWSRFPKLPQSHQVSLC